MGAFDTFLADTVGVVYRATSGNVDPWTKRELIDKAAADLVKAGMTPDEAQAQAEADTNDTLDTFSLGGGDRTGAQGWAFNLPSWQAFKDAFGGKDNGSGCGVTNIAGCYPSWLPWVLGGAGVLVVLYVLGPYVGLLERRD